MESGCPKASQQQKNREIVVENPQVVLHNNDIPQDIVYEILTRLPVKSLLRFKSVSKLWHSTISNPTFCRRSPATSVFATSGSNSKDFYLMDEEGGIEKFRVPAWSLLENKDRFPEVSNSCNGMLLLRHGTAIFLFNPSTRNIERVLALDKYYDNENLVSLWFYYDESIADYKVVVFFWQLNTGDKSAIVATLKKKEWTALRIPREFFSIRLGTLVNDRLHLMVGLDRRHGYNAIAYVNPNKDVFEKVACPQPKSGYTDAIVGLGVLDDCLCMTRRIGNSFCEGDYEVLKMKEYGVAESWTTMLIIKIPYVYWMDPLLRIKNGDIVLFEDIYAMSRYNPAKKHINLIECGNISTLQLHRAVSFTENLFTPNSSLVKKYRGDSYTRNIRVCYKCGEAGHIARDCSNAGDTGDTVVVVLTVVNKPLLQETVDVITVEGLDILQGIADFDFAFKRTWQYYLDSSKSHLFCTHENT